MNPVTTTVSPDLLASSLNDFGRIAPVAIVAFLALLALVLDMGLPAGRKGAIAVVTVIGLGVAALLQLSLIAPVAEAMNHLRGLDLPVTDTRGSAFGGALRIDWFGQYFSALLLVLGALVTLQAPAYLERRGLAHAEFYPLLLLSLAGMMLLVQSANLVMIFLSVELLSVGLYVMAGFDRRDHRSQEAAMKYLIIGAFASAFLLYGLALLYGSAGSTDLGQVAQAVAQAANSGGGALVMPLAGAALVLVGLAFKTSTAPFHQWTPDVYEGSPSIVTGFMSVGTKIAAFAVLVRLFDGALLPLAPHWTSIIALLAYISIGVGNLVALLQTRLKRMLAYSGIAHAGYLLLGLFGSSRGAGAIAFYATAYLLMNFGAFAVIVACARSGRDADSYDDISGLAYERPWLAAAMSVFMLSLAGFPPTIGFIGKLLLFQSALEVGASNVVIWAAVFSVVSAYYYLRVIALMYGQRRGEGAGALRATAGLGSAIALTALAAILFGIVPGGLVNAAEASAQDLLGTQVAAVSSP
ncbi:MAG: NADH-quinone oxidoreductase subunit N [Candidatus Dormibacteria bacterium]